MVEHAVKFPERNQAEKADQSPKRELIPRERDQQRNCPENDGTAEAQDENGPSACGFTFEFPRSRDRHEPSSSEGLARLSTGLLFIPKQNRSTASNRSQDR